MALCVLGKPVDVVELDLRKVPIPQGKDLFEDFGRVMERKAEAADAAFFFLMLEICKDIKFFKRFEGFGRDAVAQVKIEIVDAAALELLFEDALHIAGHFQVPGRHLIGQEIALARIFGERAL